jgi:hypothetical protein
MVGKDPLKLAMEDVTSVAEELNKLHLQVKQYESSSKRMDGISNTLVNLSKSVQQTEENFSIALVSAKSIERSVGALLKSVPDVIGKIESSDAARSISDLSSALAETKSLIESNRIVVDSLTQSMLSDREQHSKIFQEIGDKTERLVKDVAQQYQLLQLINQVLTQNVATSVTANTKSIAEMKTLINEGAEKSAKTASLATTNLQNDVMLIKAEVEATRKMTEQNFTLLETMSKKKWFQF